MNFKMKTLAVAAVAAFAMSAGAANAATSAAAGNSSVIFSAWDANGSYSLDLGSFLNTFVGADVAVGTNPGSTFNGGTLDIALTGFNLTSGSWNLVAGDNNGRNRLLVTQSGTLAGVTNSQVKTAAQDIKSYLDMGAATSTTTGTLGTPTDPWYANSNTWGDNLGGTFAVGGTSNDLSQVSNLYSIWQTSQVAGQASAAAGFAQLHNAAGDFYTAKVIGTGANAVLEIAAVSAVPEADSWAMLLAGLGLMGFIARRRTQA
jgi:MYXO-CTERM domain-containing protein